MDFRADQIRADQGRATPPAPKRVVRCAACGRIEAVSAQDLAGYMQAGWPHRCGGVMTYSLDADPPPDSN